MDRITARDIDGDPATVVTGDTVRDGKAVKVVALDVEQSGGPADNPWGATLALDLPGVTALITALTIARAELEQEARVA